MLDHSITFKDDDGDEVILNLQYILSVRLYQFEESEVLSIKLFDPMGVTITLRKDKALIKKLWDAFRQGAKEISS